MVGSTSSNGTAMDATNDEKRNQKNEGLGEGGKGYTTTTGAGTLAGMENVDEVVTSSSSGGERQARGDASSDDDMEFQGEDAVTRREKEGKESMSRLSWVRCAVLLCVEAIALGALSLPSAFAALGMVAGTIITVGTGLIAIWGGLVCGNVYCITGGEVTSYVHVGRVLFRPLGPRWAKFGFEFVGSWFVLLLVFNLASHCLTGALMWQSITAKPDVCSIVWVVVSALMLLLLALPNTFHGATYLGYIDFISIIAAILITMISTGVTASSAPGGLSAVQWSALPPASTDFVTAFGAVASIVFAYSFNVVLFSFQSEMHTPKDIKYAVWSVGGVQIVIYVLTGALIYAFVGNDVASPALLSAPGLIQRIAFGVALPVIFFSGAINGNCVARYVHGRIYENSRHKYINTAQGWIVWVSILAFESVIALIIAEAIPFFSDLLDLISSLFISGFSFYLPAIMWLALVRKGSIFARHNILQGCMALFTLAFGLVVLVAGLYSSVTSIKQEYTGGSVRTPFSCPDLSSSEA